MEDRGGRPATVRGAQGARASEAGVLRIDFPGDGDDRLQAISWEEFFRKFDGKRLAFLYQDTTRAGEQGRFFKLVRCGPAGRQGRRRVLPS